MLPSSLTADWCVRRRWVCRSDGCVREGCGSRGIREACRRHGGFLPLLLLLLPSLASLLHAHFIHSFIRPISQPTHSRHTRTRMHDTQADEDREKRREGRGEESSRAAAQACKRSKGPNLSLPDAPSPAPPSSHLLSAARLCAALRCFPSAAVLRLSLTRVRVCMLCLASASTAALPFSSPPLVSALDSSASR